LAEAIALVFEVKDDVELIFGEQFVT